MLLIDQVEEDYEYVIRFSYVDVIGYLDKRHFSRVVTVKTWLVGLKRD